MSYDLPRLLHKLSRFSPVLKSLISLPVRYDMFTVSYNTSHTSKSFLFLFGLLRYITVTINTEKHINTANARSAQLKYHSLVIYLPAQTQRQRPPNIISKVLSYVSFSKPFVEISFQHYPIQSSLKGYVNLNRHQRQGQQQNRRQQKFK